MQDLRLSIPDARWTDRESWHSTLKFLGEVPDDRVEDVVRVGRKVCLEASQLVTGLTELGAFPSQRRARVLWVGLEDSAGSIARLAKSMETRYAKRGFRKEGRALHPHLTLARLRVPRPVEEEVEASGPYDLDLAPFDVTETVLFRSHLSPKGSTYEALERFPLGT